MTYDEAVLQIRSGDLVFFRSTNLIQKLVAVFTRGKFAHVGFAFWMTDGSGDKQLMFVDTAPGGKKIAMMASYQRSKMEIVSVRTRLG